jgi:hypothetical protein
MQQHNIHITFSTLPVYGLETQPVQAIAGNVPLVEQDGLSCADA